MDNTTFLAEYDEILLPKDIQNILHIGRRTTYRLLEDGTIKSLKIGKFYRIPKQNLEEYIFSKSDISLQGDNS